LQFAPDNAKLKIAKELALPTLKDGRKIKPAGNNVYKK
jgi:hypothetical protein